MCRRQHEVNAVHFCRHFSIGCKLQKLCCKPAKKTLNKWNDLDFEDYISWMRTLILRDVWPGQCQIFLTNAARYQRGLSASPHSSDESRGWAFAAPGHPRLVRCAIDKPEFEPASARGETNLLQPRVRANAVVTASILCPCAGHWLCASPRFQTTKTETMPMRGTSAPTRPLFTSAGVDRYQQEAFHHALGAHPALA